MQKKRLVWWCVVVGALVGSALCAPHDPHGTTELVECGSGQDQVDCKPRTGPAEIPGGEESAQALHDLLVTFLTEPTPPPSGPDGSSSSSSSSSPSSSPESALVRALGAKVEDTVRQMGDIRTTIEYNQCEIDAVTQQLVPELQRCAVTNTIKASAIRDAMAIANEQSQALSRSLPRANFLEEQRSTSAVIADLTTMRHTIHASSALGPSSELGVEVAELLDAIVENVRHAADLQRQSAASEREEWGESIEALQRVVDSLSATLRHLNRRAFACLAAAMRFKQYLNALTAQQYRALEWYHAMKADIAAHSRHTTQALADYEDVRVLAHELLHLLQHGDTPYTPTTSEGCDGLGGKLDVCGVCGGDNSTCADCNGNPNGGAQLDVCGECGQEPGESCRYFCDNVPNSGKVEDLCGVCGGDDSTCVGCDSLPHSPLQYDTCGVCGGDGLSCAKAKGCEGVSCPSTKRCAHGLVVTGEGFRGCCFDPKVDCVDPTN